MNEKNWTFCMDEGKTEKPFLVDSVLSPNKIRRKWVGYNEVSAECDDEVIQNRVLSLPSHIIQSLESAIDPIPININTHIRYRGKMRYSCLEHILEEYPKDVLVIGRKSSIM